MNSLLIIIFVICLIFLWFTVKTMDRQISWVECALGIVLSTAVVGLTYWAGMRLEVSDEQILHGQVIGKESRRVSCEHSYQCNCRKVKTSSGTSTECQTCYEHGFDKDWIVKSDIGEFLIERVDRQGLREPSRFTEAFVGEPASKRESYINYVPKVPQSLFNAIYQAKALDLWSNEVNGFNYPLSIEKKYRYAPVIDARNDVKTQMETEFIDPVRFLGVKEQLSDAIENLNARLGVEKKVSVKVILTNYKSESFARALEAKWFNGKQNDVLVFVGLKEGESKQLVINWVRVSSWAKNNMLKVQMRDELMAIDSIEKIKQVKEVIEANVRAHYNVLILEKEFDYLKYEIATPWWLIALMLLLAAGSMAAGIHVAKRVNW